MRDTMSFQPPPFGLRIAAILLAAVGFYGLLGALGVSIPLLTSHRGPWLPLVLDPVGDLLICVAAVLIWLRRRVGVLVLVGGWLLPTAANLYAGRPVQRPGVLMMLALLMVAANVRRLR
jgi:hypothetical protein